MPSKKTVLIFFVISILLVCFSIYTKVNTSYPNYFIWDMDQISSIDTILIQSDKLPSHVNHTGFGMYLLLSTTQNIAKSLNILSGVSLNDLQSSLNPIAILAELVEFNRKHCPYIGLTIIVLLTSSLAVYLSVNWWCILVSILILCSQESLLYHSSMIRTEFYSIFFWSISLFFLFLLLRGNDKNLSIFFSTLIGCFLGLSLFTKIQAFIYVIATILLLISLYPKPNLSLSTSNDRPLITTLISFLSASAFTFLCLLSHRYSVPEGIPTWTLSYKITSIAIIILSGYWILFFLLLSKTIKRNFTLKFYPLTCWINYVGFGFIISISLHFLIFSKFNTSWEYLLLDFKMMFMRENIAIEGVTLLERLDNFAHYFNYNPMLFGCNFSMLVLLGFQVWKGRIPCITRSNFIMLFVVTFLCYLNSILGTRFILRDTIWNEIFINFLTIFCFYTVVTKSKQKSLKVFFFAAALCSILIFTNINKSLKMPIRLDALYTQYGWSKGHFYTSSFGQGNHKLYIDILRKRYTEAPIGSSIHYAQYTRKLKRIVDFVFQNQVIPLRNIGVCEIGQPVWTDKISFKIIDHPDELTSAILVDSNSIEKKENYFFDANKVRNHSEFLNKISPSKTNHLSLLTRKDLTILLFVSGGDKENLTNEYLEETNYVIKVSDKTHVKDFIGLKVENYLEINLDKISKRYFFVIQESEY